VKKDKLKRSVKLCLRAISFIYLEETIYRIERGELHSWVNDFTYSK